jgi:hypothetical protein
MKVKVRLIHNNIVTSHTYEAGDSDHYSPEEIANKLIRDINISFKDHGIRAEAAIKKVKKFNFKLKKYEL